ncbi:AtpZ/AtpI family protein [Campylobacter upsaliensis]|uniref:AtpZ/AtpI family protein n=1 Tax=Campylobacter upsaliensis TaxID=28080 RepID=UPI000E1B06A2|nr:AtpZ/AtpI family protein [Campylobacter upsaliensis]EAI0686551.1 AtpZ/AtpI family protein [Campylobacter upsaliensis]EAI9481097.1 AtpZ/AtpI family protein [Campylobacter upsaliensis]EAJ8015530.1 AtpZ/AtpI family protein [Campylobacter upsaliensis]EAK0471174.1 AtpZ/AtpI family protein [Campylobacter upsaliensis]EAK5560137.1 AtpZ/AtpI family protein [Campylobacter upsaliensis]
MSKRKIIIRKGLEAADGLSLGTSMVVAVLLGIGLGFLLKNITPWLFWVGVFIGVAAAILNVYKAYKTQMKSYEEFEKRDALIQESLKKE